MEEPRIKKISPTVLALGVVSLFTDLSSEMIYPLLPIFLSSVLGAGAFALGLIEGLAEATASILKIVSGYLTDRTGKRKPFVLWGYSLSSMMRPLIGLATAWPVVLGLRFMDRVGKGIRTSPRDALIADVTDYHYTGQAYGFHRAMDHGGAVLGPLVAVFLLKWLGLPLRGVFLLAAIPGVIVIIILSLFVKEEGGKSSAVPPSGKGNFDPKLMGRDFRTLLLGVTLFTLGNSTDAFLLLRLNAAGVEAAGTAVLWSLFHIIKMTSTYGGGWLSDLVGRKSMIIAGWLYYAAIYLLFALFEGKSSLIGIFLLYGIYFGLTEPTQRAWVASLVPAKLRGKAFGLYHGAIGLAALPASLIFGLIWQRLGYQYAFLTGSIFALLGCLFVARVREERTAGT